MNPLFYVTFCCPEEGGSGNGNSSRSFSRKIHVRIVCGPRRVKAGTKP